MEFAVKRASDISSSPRLTSLNYIEDQLACKRKCQSAIEAAADGYADDGGAKTSVRPRCAGTCHESRRV
jgi:hypothetical protein